MALPRNLDLAGSIDLPSTVSQDNTTKSQKTFNSKKQLIQNLRQKDPGFARTALRMILDFVETIEENVLAFKNANDDQTMFFQSVVSFAKNRRMHSLFDEDCQVLLRKIERVLTEKCPFDMNVDVDKMDKETRRRTVSLLKHPKGIFKKADVAFVRASAASISMNRPASKPQKPPIPAHTKPITSIQAKSQSKDSAGSKNRTTDNTKNENMRPTDNTGVRTYRKLGRNVSEIKSSDVRVTAHMIYTTIDNSKPDNNSNTTDENRNTEQLELRTQSDGRPLPFRKAKLLDDMAVPVKSKMGSRIMSQMGWNGGPLGARGEGITEPIVPALHLTAGAGLGHVKPKKEISAAAVKYLNFRLDLLKHFHSLILEEPLKRTVLYDNQLCKKERAFLNIAVKCLNMRKGVYLNDEALHDTVQPLLEEMACEPKLQVYAAVYDKRAITMGKNSVSTSKPPPPVQPSPAPTPESVLSFVAKHARSSFISMEAITKLGKDLMPGHVIKSARSLGHRVVMLARIYELVNSVAGQKVLTFEQSLTCKQVTYINEVVASFNSRSKFTYCTVYENYIAVETLKVAGDDFLVVTFAENQMSLTIKKKYHLKRKNGAKDVEVATTSYNKNVISKELKTTVNNNKIDEKVTQKAEKCNNRVVDDDVVIFIPSADGNIIEISSESDLTDSDVMEINKCSKKKAKDLVIRNKGACSVEPVNLNIEEFEKIKLDDDKKSDLGKDEEHVVNKEQAVAEEQTKETAYDESDECFASFMKRCRSDSIESTPINKKLKLVLPKYLCIAPESTSEEVTADIIQSFQTLICNRIDEIPERPFIECIGVKNGGIVYGCHNDIGISLVEGIAHEINLRSSNVTKLYENGKRYKLNARINSYLDINLKKLFTQLEDYNFGLKTDSWTVTDVQKNTDCVEMRLEVDGFSFEYIAGCYFSLFVGMDKIKFCITWD